MLKKNGSHVNRVITYACKYWNICSVVSAVFIDIFQHNQRYDTLHPITPCMHKLKPGIANYLLPSLILCMCSKLLNIISTTSSQVNHNFGNTSPRTIGLTIVKQEANNRANNCQTRSEESLLEFQILGILADRWIIVGHINVFNNPVPTWLSESKSFACEIKSITDSSNSNALLNLRLSCCKYKLKIVFWVSRIMDVITMECLRTECANRTANANIKIQLFNIKIPFIDIIKHGMNNKI
jgi:hypothetical protein